MELKNHRKQGASTSRSNPELVQKYNFRLIREKLIDGDFGANMRLLQNTENDLDIQTIIHKADEGLS